MEHTQHPWHVMDTPATREIFNDCSVIVSEHIEDAIIATIGEDVPNWEGNARIMAAAPELLTALKIARSYVASEVSWQRTAQQSHVDDAELAQIDAAIAKAEGR